MVAPGSREEIILGVLFKEGKEATSVDEERISDVNVDTGTALVEEGGGDTATREEEAIADLTAIVVEQESCAALVDASRLAGPLGDRVLGGAEQLTPKGMM